MLLYAFACNTQNHKRQEIKNIINYSIIIPHKNIPDLLKTCLDSILVRKNIEIIIAEDNSSDDIVKKSVFPGKTV